MKINLKNTSGMLAATFGLAAAFCLLAPVSTAQMVGPPDPASRKPAEAPPNPVDTMKNSFLKLFKKQEETEETTQKPAAGQNGAAKLSKPPAKPGEGTAAEPEKAAPKMPSRPPLLTPPTGPNAKIEAPEVSKENPPKKLLTLDNPTNPLGFADAQAKLAACTALIDKKEYAMAKATLGPLKQWLIDSTEAHLSLYKTLDNVSSAHAQAELEKQLALQFALLRDKAIFQSARIDIAEKDLRGAVKGLTEVVKSQPRSEMGIKSYKMLQEIGFTEKLQLAE